MMIDSREKNRNIESSFEQKIFASKEKEKERERKIH